MTKQSQKGGEGSNNFQAQQMLVQVGIDEKRAREIYNEKNLQLKKDYTEEALEIVDKRISEFENRLMPRMENVKGALEAFADPSFQLLLVEAQKTAAATEREADYDLLSELLIHRFQKGENRMARAGINRAVEIVDEISDDALVGLTAFHAVSTFLPVTGDILQGLDVLDRMFGKLLYAALPTSRDWLDHLDILDAVRLSSFGGLKKVEQYYAEQLIGYVDVGIKKNSDDLKKASDLLRENGLPKGLLIEHTFNTDYMRISIPNRKQIESLQLVTQQYSFTPIQTPLTQNQKNALNSVYNLYENNSSVKSENIRLFTEALNKKSNLRAIKAWWNNLDLGVQVTSVGKVLAHSNAQRCDKTLPPLD